MDMSSDGCTRVQLGPTGGTCGRGSEGFSAAAAAESDVEGCWDRYAGKVAVLAPEDWGVGCSLEKMVGGGGCRSTRAHK